MEEEMRAALDGIVQYRDPSYYVDSLERILDQYLDSTHMKEGETEQRLSFYQNILPVAVSFLLQKDYDDDGTVLCRVHQFLLKSLQFAIQNIEVCKEMLRVLLTILTPYSGKRGGFYATAAGWKLEDLEPVVTKSRPSRDPWSVPQTLQYYVECFNSLGGFEKLVQLASSPQVSLEGILLCSKLLYKVQDVLQTSFFESYFPSFLQPIEIRLLTMEEEEMKSVDKTLLTKIRTVLNKIDSSSAVDRLFLELSLKFFRSFTIEKRLYGLNEMKSLIYQAESSHVVHMHEMMTQGGLSGEFMVAWLRSNQIMEELYLRNPHPELLQRCVEIPRLLAIHNCIEERDVDMIWNAGENKHESVQQIILKTLNALCHHFPQEIRDYFFQSKLRKKLFHTFTVNHLELVQTVSACNFRSPHKVASEYDGLEFLWEMIQDDSGLPQDCRVTAVEILKNLLAWSNCAAHRKRFIENCLENLQKQVSPTTSVHLIQKILESSFPQYNYDGGSRLDVFLENMNKEHRLISLIITSLHQYHENAKKELQKDREPPLTRGANLNSEIITGGRPHLTTVNTYLNLLELVLREISYELTENDIDLLWDSIILQPLTDEEMDAAFQWLRFLQKRALSDSHLSASEIFYIFTAKIPTLNFASLPPSAFETITDYFNFCNWKHNNLSYSTQHKYNITCEFFALMGIDLIWTVALTCECESVARSAITLLDQLRSGIKSQLARSESDKFAQYSMERLVDAATRLQNSYNSHDATHRDADEMQVSRCLDILTCAITTGMRGQSSPSSHGSITKGKRVQVKVQYSGNSTRISSYSNERIGELRKRIAGWLGTDNRLVRLLSGGKEMKDDSACLSQVHDIYHDATIIVALRPKEYLRGIDMEESLAVEANSPSSLSSCVNFRRIFDLLGYKTQIAQQAWDLLMILPTDGEMLQQLSAEQNVPDWSEVFGTSSYRMLYSLQIVQSRMDHDDNDQWCEWFMRSGGVEYMLRILLSTHLLHEDQGSKRKLCLQILLHILVQFSLCPEEQMHEKIRCSLESLETSQLPLQLSRAAIPLFQRNEVLTPLLDICRTVSIKEPPQNQLNSAPTIQDVVRSMSEEDWEIAKLALKLFTACSLSLENFFDRFASHSDSSEWLYDTFIRTPNYRIRHAIGQSILELSDSSPVSVSRSAKAQHIHKKAFQYFLTSLLDYLDRIKENTSNCEQYFSVLGELLTKYYESSAADESLTFPSDVLLRKLVSYIVGHPITETNNFLADTVLVGLLNTVNVLVRKAANISPEVTGTLLSDLTAELFGPCLFDTPSTLSKSSRSDSLQPPKCKTPVSREAAFRLLVSLSRDETRFSYLSKRLLDLLEGTESTSNWLYYPRGLEKSPCGYVGLRNLGSTCYINSLLQQLYMNPRFCNCILSLMRPQMHVDEASEKHAEAKSDFLVVLRELQKLFVALGESAKKYADTTSFCSQFKDHSGDPINPSVQMDADEFFNMLFDKLENAMVHDLGEKNHLSSIFGGKLCNQIISKECEHISETVEPFYTLSVAVKGKSSLQESLDLYVEGDLLEGDNKYHCGKCNAKVDALKRVCIQELPDHLIIHMRRFEFDLELLTRMKVNDYCQFPLELNMEEYTKEGLSREDNSAVKGDPKYLYELVGVLVHTGTAEAGHYYSFIQDRETKQWYHFNDSLVEPFDPSDIPNQCFGGIDHSTQYDPIHGSSMNHSRLNINNAYMLMYQRVGVENRRSPENNENPFFRQVSAENTRFWNDTHLFDENFFSFMWDFCQLTPSDSIYPVTQLESRFVAEILSRAKENDGIGRFVAHLKESCTKSNESCLWLLQSFLRYNWVVQLLLECPVPTVRTAIADLIIHVLHSLSESERNSYCYRSYDIQCSTLSDLYPGMDFLPIQAEPLETLSEGMMDPKKSVDRNHDSHCIAFMDSYLRLLKGARVYHRNFGQFFLPPLLFSRIGEEEKYYFLNRSVIGLYIHFFLESESPYADSSVQSRSEDDPSQRPLLCGSKYSVPDVEAMLELISELGIFAFVKESQEETVLSQVDRALLFHIPFYGKLLRAGCTSTSLGRLLCVLCHENRKFSEEVVELLQMGLTHSECRECRPYVHIASALFSVEDSMTNWRLNSLLDTILSSIKKLSHSEASVYLLKKLVALCEVQPAVHQWFADSLPAKGWLYSLLINSSNDRLRGYAANLCRAIDPPPTPETPTSTNRLMLHSLLSLLTKAKQNVRRDSCRPYLIETRSKTGGVVEVEHYPSPWQLVDYLALIREYVATDEDREIVMQHLEESFYPLHDYMDQWKQECDENKFELMRLWNTLYVETSSPDLPQWCLRLTSDDTIRCRLMDFFVSLNATQEFIAYNRRATPYFYRFLRVLCEHDKEFLQFLSAHQNFDWAIKHMYLTTEYPEVALQLRALLEMAVPVTSAQSRRQHIDMVLMDRRRLENANVCHYLRLLLIGRDELATFWKKGGIGFLLRMPELDALEEMNGHSLDKSHVHTIECFLDILLTSCNGANDFLSIFNAHMDIEVKLKILGLLRSYLDNLVEEEGILKRSYRVLEALAAFDKGLFYESLLEYLRQEHHFYHQSCKTGFQKPKVRAHLPEHNTDLSEHREYYRMLENLIRLTFCTPNEHQMELAASLAMYCSLELQAEPSMAEPFHQILGEFIRTYNEHPALHSILKEFIMSVFVDGATSLPLNLFDLLQDSIRLGWPLLTKEEIGSLLKMIDQVVQDTQQILAENSDESIRSSLGEDIVKRLQYILLLSERQEVMNHIRIHHLSIIRQVGDWTVSHLEQLTQSEDVPGFDMNSLLEYAARLASLYGEE